MTASHRPARAGAAGLAVAGLLAAVALTGCSGGSDAVDQAAGSGLRYVPGERVVRLIAADERRPAPELRGQLLDGSPYDAAVLDGSVVVVNVWGSWCAPCRAEADNLVRVAEATKPAGVAFLGLNVKDSTAAARAFEQNKGVTYPSFDDQAGRLALRFRDVPPSAIPSTIVIDRGGRVAALFLGPVTDADLLPVVQDVAREQV